MSEDVIIISSDEDSDTVEFPKKSEYVDCPTLEITQSLNEEISTNECKESTANLINYPVSTKEATEICNKTEKGNKSLEQSSYSSSVAIKTESNSNSTEIIENNICGSKCEIYKKFMTTVLSVEPEEESKVKLFKKLNKYYKLADPDYIRSPEFIKFIENGIEKINKNPLHLYFVLKEAKDYLISSRVEFRFKKDFKGKLSNSNAAGNTSTENSKDKTVGSEDGINSYEDEKKHKIVKKLCAILRKLEKKIKELEEAEVDFSDEENSSYFKMQRFRERYCQVYKKLCTYTNQPLNANRINSFRKINFSETGNLELNRAIEKWLNKTKRFPDFLDVFQLIEELNKSLSLELSKMQVRVQAEVVFEKIGNMLQRRRHYDLWDSLSTFLNADVDPATKDPKLNAILEKNFEMRLQKEKELIRYYVEKQEEEKVHPLEVPDDEANSSPLETSDEDENEIVKAENMLISKISTGGENSDESDEETKSGNNSSCRFSSGEGEESLGNVDPFNNKPEEGQNKVRAENCNGVEHSDNTLESEKRFVTSNNVKQSKLPVEDNSIRCGSATVKREENDTENVNSMKRLRENQITKRSKKTKLINVGDSDSDCKIVDILSDEEKSQSNVPSIEHKVHQINFAFINSNFNYNRILSSNIFKKKNGFCSKFKNVKYQQSHSSLLLTDLANIKSIKNKYAGYRDNRIKRRVKNVIRKQKFLSLTRFQLHEEWRLKRNSFISLTKNSITCALQQDTGSEKVQKQKQGDKISESNGFQGGSSDESISSPNNGSSGGGNGQDNSENNGNKKPFDQEKQVEDNQENEDKEDGEEESKDDKKADTEEIPGADCTVPKLCSSTETYQIGKNESDAAESKISLPSKKKTVTKLTRTRNMQRISQIITEKIIEREMKKSSFTDPGTKTLSSRKKKLSRNGEAQSTSRQVSVSKNSDLRKMPATNFRQAGNKVSQTFPKNQNDIEIIEVPEKKRSARVRTVQSDEEIVKNFLQRSHPAISIKTPKKRTVQNEPPPSVIQALKTLSQLKGISTTIVKGSSKYKTDEDVTVIGESLNTRVNKMSRTCAAPKANISAPGNFDCLIPKIVTVQGNVSGFENMTNDSMDDSNQEIYEQNPQLRMGGNATNYDENFTCATDKVPIPRFRNVKSRSRRTPKIQTKNVEYVVLDD